MYMCIGEGHWCQTPVQWWVIGNITVKSFIWHAYLTCRYRDVPFPMLVVPDLFLSVLNMKSCLNFCNMNESTMLIPLSYSLLLSLLYLCCHYIGSWLSSSELVTAFSPRLVLLLIEYMGSIVLILHSALRVQIQVHQHMVIARSMLVPGWRLKGCYDDNMPW